MKIYEKPMAIINKFEVEDVIAASVPGTLESTKSVADTTAITGDTTNQSQGVIFQW